MKPKSCLLYAWDNHDSDVLLNSIVFYRSIGYTVKVSTTFEPADVLVVLRITPEIHIPSNQYSCIHIYEYIIHEASRCIKKDFAHKTTLISLDETQLNFASNVGARTIKSFLPIIPNLWSSLPKRSVIKIIHIGNFKQQASTDVTQNSIVELSSEGVIELWGEGWPETAQSLGKHLMCNLSKTYSSSTLTLGSMYPHQRGKSFSGRMWHAPLCGCFCLVETNSLNSAPGLIFNASCSSPQAIAEQISYQDRVNLFNDSSLYWKNHNQNLAVRLGEELSHKRVLALSTLYRLFYINTYLYFKENLKMIINHSLSLFKRFII